MHPPTSKTKLALALLARGAVGPASADGTAAWLDSRTETWGHEPLLDQ